MSYLESLKEIYKSIAPEMDYCIFAPDLDEDKWESDLNNLASQEDPISVLCIGKATAKGLLSILSASRFLLTHEKLYMENIKEGMKFSEIMSITYSEEEKRTLLGKIKVEGLITIEKTSGEKENLRGNYATKEIVEFLNKIVVELKKNPPPVTYKDCQNVSKIADIIKANIKGDEKYWKILPDITNEELTSFIIHFAKNEMKSCFAAIYEDYSGEKLYFTNDSLYYYKKTGKIDKVKYENLSNASYFEKRKEEENGNLIFSQNVILYDKNKKVFFENSNIEKKFADIFNNIISLITGKDIKTEVHKEKDVFFTLLEKCDEFFSNINILEPIEIQATGDEIMATSTSNGYTPRKKMPVYLCKTADNYEFEYAEKWIDIDTYDNNIYKQYGRFERCKSVLRCLYYKFSKKDIIFSIHFYLTTGYENNYRIKLECSLLEEPVYLKLGFPIYNTDAAEFTKKMMKKKHLEELWKKIDALTYYLSGIQEERKAQEEIALKEDITKKNNEVIRKLDEI